MIVFKCDEAPSGGYDFSSAGSSALRIMKTPVLTPDQMRQKLADQPVTATQEEAGAAMMRAKGAEKKVNELAKKLEAIREKPKMTPAQLREGLDLLFSKYDFSPAEELIRTSMQTDDVSLATRINMFLLEFVLPKLKSVEVSGTIDHNHVVVIRRFGQPDEPAKILGRIQSPIDAEVINE